MKNIKIKSMNKRSELGCTCPACCKKRKERDLLVNKKYNEGPNKGRREYSFKISAK